MQSIWNGIIVLVITLPVIYFIGFAMNDILKDIKRNKESVKTRKKVEHQSTKTKVKASRKSSRRYLKEVK